MCSVMSCHGSLIHEREGLSNYDIVYFLLAG